MIDPQTGVPGIGVPEEFPEGVNALLRVERANRINPPLRQQPVI